MPLYHTYRPKMLKDFTGNQEETAKIRALLKKDFDDPKWPRVFLITGKPGIGKTTLARIISAKLGVYDPSNPNDMDYREIDCADNRGIADMRKIKEASKIHPFSKPYCIWVLDEFHQTTRDAFSSLLKVLEEPPRHCFFFLCTSEGHKLPSSIIRRACQINLQPLKEDDLSNVLYYVCEKEGKEIDVRVKNQIIEKAEGSPGMALNILDSLIDLSPKQQLKAVENFKSLEEKAINLCRILIKENSKWNEVNKILTELKEEDIEGIRRMIMSYTTSIVLKKMDGRCFLIQEAFKFPFYDNGFPGLANACLSLYV